jgi:hypothetical protein
MSYLYDKLNSLQWELNQKVEAIIDEMREVKPEELYLDTRSAYRLYVDEEYIAVQKGSDLKNLRYYGGFEYVSEEYVLELGEYVFYHSEDERICDHLAQYFQNQEEKEDV